MSWDGRFSENHPPIQINTFKDKCQLSQERTERSLLEVSQKPYIHVCLQLSLNSWKGSLETGKVLFVCNFLICLNSFYLRKNQLIFIKLSASLQTFVHSQSRTASLPLMMIATLTQITFGINSYKKSNHRS